MLFVRPNHRSPRLSLVVRAAAVRRRREGKRKSRSEERGEQERRDERDDGGEKERRKGKRTAAGSCWSREEAGGGSCCSPPSAASQLLPACIPRRIVGAAARQLRLSSVQAECKPSARTFPSPTSLSFIPPARSSHILFVPLSVLFSSSLIHGVRHLMSLPSG